MKHIKQLILGVQFLTRIPITKKNVPAEPSDFKGAMTFFALIGLIIGLIQWAGFVVVSYLIGPLGGALVTTLIGIWLTGGLHLDGLADVWDGFLANQEAERTLEIMKDSRVGAFGALALIIDLLIHFVGIYTLKDHIALYVLVPVCAKVGVCLLCLIGKTIKKGLGALWIGNIDLWQVGINSVMILLVGIVNQSILLAVGAVMITYLITQSVCQKATRKLGGITGDLLGACHQFVEWGIIAYLMFAIKHIL